MSIQVTCSSCAGVFNAPDAAGGKRTKCPKCGGAIQIPAPKPSAALAAEERRFGFSDEELGLDAPSGRSNADDRKPCPMCGEMIAAEAVKCRFCGEVLDPTVASVLGASGDARDPAWRHVRGGLATMYYCIGAIFAAVAIIVVTAMIVFLGVPEGAQRREDPPGELVFVLGLGGIAIIGAAFGALIGQARCAVVPPRSGARGYVIGSVVCLVANIGMSIVGEAVESEAISGLGSLFSLAGYVLFILFLRRSASYLGDAALSASAGRFLIFVVALFASLIVGAVLAGVLATPAVLGILGLVVILGGLVAIIWFLRLVKALMSTIDRRMKIA